MIKEVAAVADRSCVLNSWTERRAVVRESTAVNLHSLLSELEFIVFAPN